MSDQPREAPPGLPAPSGGGMSDQTWKVVLAVVLSVIAGVLVGWWEEDVQLGAWVAGSFYFFSLLTIIALKD